MALVSLFEAESGVPIMSDDARPTERSSTNRHESGESGIASSGESSVEVARIFVLIPKKAACAATRFSRRHSVCLSDLRIVINPAEKVVDISRRVPMATQKIIVPTDFSPKSEAALEYAATLAHETGARLIIVHVQELPVVYPEGSYYYGLPVPDKDGVRSMLENLKPAVPGVAFEHRLLKGDPAMQIAALAKDDKADLIVMSSHGRSGLGRLVLGSVAEAVMRRAACPILIVKPSVKAEPIHIEQAAAPGIVSYE